VYVCVVAYICVCMYSLHGGHLPPGYDQTIPQAREENESKNEGHEEQATQPRPPSHQMQTRSARRRALRILEENDPDPVIMLTQEEWDNDANAGPAHVELLRVTGETPGQRFHKD
jgi:hypothetical protein